MSAETLTDEDRIAYWQGAYERMTARNVALSKAVTQARNAFSEIAEWLLNEADSESADEIIRKIFADCQMQRLALERTSPTPSAGKDRAS